MGLYWVSVVSDCVRDIRVDGEIVDESSLLPLHDVVTDSDEVGSESLGSVILANKRNLKAQVLHNHVGIIIMINHRIGVKTVRGVVLESTRRKESN